MITIRKGTSSDFKLIRDIATKAWQNTYNSILSKEQIAYMLDLFYSDAIFKINILENEHQFLLAYQDNECLGFAAYQNQYKNQSVTRLHKIYLLPEAQIKGIGKALISTIEKSALENESHKISLNVNRFNPSVAFYKKLGFTILTEENIDIGKGYLMEDYKMEKYL